MKSLCFHTRTPSMSPLPSSRGGSISISARALTLSETTMERVIESAESIIMKWDADTSAYARVTSLFYEDKRAAAQFIQRVNDLQLAMQSLVLENSVSEKLVRAHRLMEIAMKRLQKELYQILSMNRAHLDPESVSMRSSRTSVSTRSTVSDFDDEEVEDGGAVGESISEVEEASSMVMSELKAISECMISCGYGKECIGIYKIIRKSIIDEGIYRLGVERTTQSQILKMDWEAVDVRIKNWLQAVKVAMNTLFRGERILCDQVFSSSDSIRESCFSDISREGAALLFGFPEVVLKSRKSSPEKIFRLLDMYTVISEHWNEIDLVFGFESTSAIRTLALNSLIRLSESIRTLLTDFEATIQKDASKTVPPGGGVHELTITSMNYLCLLTDYSSILGDIFGDWTTAARSPLPESFFGSPARDETPAPAISVRLAWLILILFCKLDGKAKHYKEVSRSYLFLVNNLQHIVSRVRASNLQYLLGEEWIAKNEEKITQFAANYERIGWGKVIAAAVVPPEIPSASPSSFSLAEAQECFRKFNSSFEEAYQKQSSSVVVDAELRERITNSLKEKMVGAYREMYETQKMAVEEMRNAAMFIKYSPEDVDECLSQLFVACVNLRSCSSMGNDIKNEICAETPNESIIVQSRIEFSLY